NVTGVQTCALPISTQSCWLSPSIFSKLAGASASAVFAAAKHNRAVMQWRNVMKNFLATCMQARRHRLLTGALRWAVIQECRCVLGKRDCWLCTQAPVLCRPKIMGLGLQGTLKHRAVLVSS